MIVKGESQLKDGAKEQVSSEFTRDFTLPSDVDSYSIKAQLDEATRQLSLIGNVSDKKEPQSTSLSSGFMDAIVGSVRETQTTKSIDYEIYLGKDFKDGRSTIELSGYNTLTIKVSKTDFDRYGELNLELKRQIKLPSNANAHNIEHGIDAFGATLIVKVPLK